MKKASDLLTEQAEAEKSIEKKKGASLFLLVGKGLHFSWHTVYTDRKMGSIKSCVLMETDPCMEPVLYRE